MVLVIMTGRSAAGKSSVAAALAKRLGAVLLSTDELRMELFKKHDFAESERDEMTSKVYGELFARAAKLLSAGRNVILDGTFFSVALRERARSLAPDSFLVSVHASEQVREARQSKKGLPEHLYEEPDDADIVFDTGNISLEECIEQVLARLKR
jgi:predicted kinase